MSPSPLPHVPPGDGARLTRRTLLRGGVAAGAGLFAAACGAGTKPMATGGALRHVGPSAATTGSGQGSGTSASPSPSASATHAPPPDPASVKANELGYVPVMMYHRVTPKIQGEFDTTPADFRAGLQRLFSRGYRPARTIDLVRGEFDVAAGYTPVVLTFDDGYDNQFRMTKAGEIDPESAVGILLDVCKQFPDCTPAGSFNINKYPFALYDPQDMRAGLRKLHELGFEIANHTYNHDNLSLLDDTAVQKDLAELQQMVTDAVPGASVLTMALPFGVAPHRTSLEHTGAWHGEKYVNEGVLLVGANPSHSPFSRKFAPLAIPRIRSTSWQHGNVPYTAKFWLDYLDHNKDLRYVSAGNPGHVTVPKSMASYVAPRFKSQLVTY